VTKFVLAYTGSGSMGDSPEEQQKIMEAWMNWFGSLGESVVDGGTPFGAACTVASDGSVRESGASGLWGYSIITADNVADAANKGKGCPVLAGGGSVEVYEAAPIG
jgi:hypothetical protein